MKKKVPAPILRLCGLVCIFILAAVAYGPAQDAWINEVEFAPFIVMPEELLYRIIDGDEGLYIVDIRPREAWEKVPNRWKWRCKICDQEFDSPYEAQRHVTEDCLPTRGCARCGLSLNGMRWQAKYCSASCRVMDSRDRGAGVPTRRTNKRVAVKVGATTTTTVERSTSVVDYCDHCRANRPHHQMPDGYWVCDKCGK